MRKGKFYYLLIKKKQYSQSYQYGYSIQMEYLTWNKIHRKALLKELSKMLKWNVKIIVTMIILALEFFEYNTPYETETH